MSQVKEYMYILWPLYTRTVNIVAASCLSARCLEYIVRTLTGVITS